MSKIEEIQRLYDLKFEGLKNGHHSFVFNVENAFFELFEYSEINEGSVRIDVQLEKSETMLIFNFSAQGHVIVPCDRCGEPFEFPLQYSDMLIAKITNQDKEYDGEVMTISPQEHTLNLAFFIYEHITIHLPFKRMHEEGKCNPEAIKKLEQLKNKNKEEKNDPRWDALKNINLQ